ncbi:MAG: methyltransferase domain-containing protein [Flavobacteriia bacterium]|nr:methyltransferase domain-containing protein [Flavobacteriia bacterium]
MQQNLSKFDPKNSNSINQNYRQKRFNFFLNEFEKIKKLYPEQTIEILDIGGTKEYWERMGFPKKGDNVRITLLNLFLNKIENNEYFDSTTGDATNLIQYSENQFHLVYSNSVIEHLYTLDNQKKMAKEVMRVGKNYFVQTPNYWFPIEPHWVFPFFQYFPESIKLLITKYTKLGHIGYIKDNEKALDRIREVRLMNLSELKEMFPNANIYNEKAFGLNKSFIAYYSKG